MISLKFCFYCAAAFRGLPFFICCSFRNRMNNTKCEPPKIGSECRFQLIAFMAPLTFSISIFFSSKVDAVKGSSGMFVHRDVCSLFFFCYCFKLTLAIISIQNFKRNAKRKIKWLILVQKKELKFFTE